MTAIRVVKDKCPDIKRMWINQPSSSQPLHKLNGTNVLAHKESDGIYKIYFLSGKVVSQLAPALCLRDGWVRTDY